MAQPAGDQFRLDSSIRRLSLAPTTQRSKVSSRNASGPTISGRPYDQLPPGAAPSAWSPESTRHATPVAVIRPPVAANETKDLPTIPRSELPHRRSSSRTPIHPALASPPRERLTNGHVRQQSLGQPVPVKPTRQSCKRHYVQAHLDTAPPKPPSNISRPNPIAPSMNSPPGPSRSQPSTERSGMSEASAYALAVAPNLVRSTSKSHAAQSKTPRPLPRPPSLSQPSGQRSASGPVQQPMFDFEFARSPTLPDLTDPRNDSKPTRPPPDTIQHKVPTYLPQHVAQHVSPPHIPPQHASPQRVSPQTVKAKASRPTYARRGPACFRALSLASVQAALLPYLSINSFLSLTGSSERLRKCFTGEVVGRWVVKSWGIQLGREKGRSWPNLTVWEGFLESLLHDPATYSTYSAQWHSLLSHLCLSHTLIVLHLRSLPPSSFPVSSPFDEEGIKHSSSFTSLVSLQRPHSRVSSVIGSDYSALQRPPKPERLVEIIMPEPLAAKAPTEPEIEVGPNKLRRRGSIGSMTSGISFMGRKRSNSEVIPVPGKTGLPPVSYPTPKRYGFRGTSSNSRSSFDGGRPGSLRPGSMYSAARPGSVYSAATGFSQRRPPMPLMENLIAPPRGWHRKSMSSSEASRPRSEWGGSPNLWSGSPNPERREGKIEPAFDQQPPYSPGRAPILRVYIPLSDKVRRWPSAEAAAATVRELDKCGATRKLRLGDLIVNTAIHQPKTTEHVLIFVPFLKHLLVPLEYKFMPTGHLPSYIDAFQLPPSYYYPFLPAPQIVFLNLTAFAERALKSVRLAYDRRDVTTASGARLSAKRYLHVAGFDIVESDHPCPEWRGMISLEAEGTLEGKAELERQFIAQRTLSGPWEIVREKSMSGSVWLRLRKE